VKNTQRTLWTALCLIVMLAVAGCAALPPQGEKKETLEERVKGYMQAQVDRKWDRAYSYFDAASREKNPRENFVSKPRNVRFGKYEIKEITVAPGGDRATVQVVIDLDMMGYDFKGAPQTQSWIREKGEWVLNWSETARQDTPFSSEKKQK
jgi:hypothetical protein